MKESNVSDSGFELLIEFFAGINLMIVPFYLIFPVFLVLSTLSLKLRKHCFLKMLFFFLKNLARLFLLVLDQLVLAIYIRVTTV